MRKLYDILVKYWVFQILDVLAILSAIGIGVVTYIDKVSEFKAAGILASVIIAVSPIVRRVLEPGVRKRHNELIKQNNRLLPLQNNIEKIFELWLAQILAIMRVDNTWRASFYVYDEGKGDDGCFRYVARMSNDPILKRKGRLFFPASQGVIGKAWITGKCISAYAQNKDSKTKESYILWLIEKFGFDYNTASKLRTQPNIIMGHIVTDDAGKKCGVIIVESTSKARCNSQHSKEEQRLFKNAVKMTSSSVAMLVKLNSEYILCEEELQEG